MSPVRPSGRPAVKLIIMTKQKLKTIPKNHLIFHFIPTLPAMSSPAGLHLQDLILDTKATASKEQKAEAVSEVDGRRGAMVLE